jgi:hypothetical protein
MPQNSADAPTQTGALLSPQGGRILVLSSRDSPIGLWDVHDEKSALILGPRQWWVADIVILTGGRRSAVPLSEVPLKLATWGHEERWERTAASFPCK